MKSLCTHVPPNTVIKLRILLGFPESSDISSLLNMYTCSTQYRCNMWKKLFQLSSSYRNKSRTYSLSQQFPRKSSRMTFLLLLLVFSARLSRVHGQSGLAEEQSDISDVQVKVNILHNLRIHEQVKRCCGEGQRLDSSDVNTPQCVPHSPNLPDEIITVEGLDLTKEPSSRKVDLTVSFEAGGSRMPTCKSSRVFSVLEQDSWLTKKGKLVQDYQVNSK